MEKRGLKQRFIKNSFWSFISLFVGKTGALIFTIILARFLMPENYGIYSIVLSTVMIFYTFADLGVNKALVRYLSFAIAKSKKKINPYYKYLLKIKLFLALTISTILLILAYPLSLYVFNNSALFLPFIVAAFYVFVISLEGFYTEMFYTIEKVQYISFKEALSQTLRITFALLVFFFIASSYHVLGIFISLIIAHFFLGILVFYYIKKLIPQLHVKSHTNINKRKIRNFVGFLTIATISGVFFSYIDSLMLGIFLKPEFVGYYRASFALVIGIVNVLAFPNAILLPVLTKINKADTEKILNNVFRYIVYLSIPASFGLLIFRSYFIDLFYGAPYLPGTLPFAFLAFAILPMVAVGAFLPMFSAKEKPQIFAKLIIITSIINIILNLILIKALLPISPNWATAGAAIATLTSWTIYFFAAFFISKKQFKLHVSLKPIIKPLISALVMTGVLYYILSLSQSINFIKGIILILLGAAIYTLLMIILKAVTKQDLNILKLLIKKN